MKFFKKIKIWRKKKAKKIFRKAPRYFYIWDIDKTYLDTHFEKFWNLIKIPFEDYKDKKNIPGAGALIRELQRRSANPILFLSASPEWLRAVLKKKMRHDGIIHPRIILKPKLSLNKRLFNKDFNDTPGFKLTHLLDCGHLAKFGLQDMKLPVTLFGDNWELDMFIYLLYQQIMKPKPLPDETLAYQLQKIGASHDQVHKIIEQKRHNCHNMNQPNVQTIIINWIKPKNIIPFYQKNDLVFISRNHFQAAVFLYLQGHLALRGLRSVAEEISLHKIHAKRLFFISLFNLHQRGYLTTCQARSIMHYLWRYHLMETRYKELWRQHKSRKKHDKKAFTQFLLKHNNIYIKNIKALQQQYDHSEEWQKELFLETDIFQAGKIQINKLRQLLQANQ